MFLTCRVACHDGVELSCLFLSLFFQYRTVPYPALLTCTRHYLRVRDPPRQTSFGSDKTSFCRCLPDNHVMYGVVLGRKNTLWGYLSAGRSGRVFLNLATCDSMRCTENIQYQPLPEKRELRCLIFPLISSSSDGKCESQNMQQRGDTSEKSENLNK